MARSPTMAGYAACFSNPHTTPNGVPAPQSAIAAPEVALNRD